MSVTKKQFLEAVEQLNDALQQLDKCKPSEVDKILKAERQGKRAWEVISTFGKEHAK